MTLYLKEELNLVLQGLVGIILSLFIIWLIFLGVPNFNTIGITSIAIGFLLWYMLLAKSKKYSMMIAVVCVMTIAFSFIY